MTEAPRRHISLGRVWEYPAPYAELLMHRVEEQFERAMLQVYGLRPDRSTGKPGKRRDLILHPVDYMIDWIGEPPSGLCEHEPCARRRVAEFGPDRGQRDTDVFENLTIVAGDWERICHGIVPAGLLGPEASAAERGVRKLRRDGKRAAILSALEVLTALPEWPDLRDGERCRRVEQHLGKPSEWCTLRTLGRAITDFESRPQPGVASV
jgi:hypothetical protein